jgi:hypothetical protein
MTKEKKHPVGKKTNHHMDDQGVLASYVFTFKPIDKILVTSYS